ncbi:MAG: response regulator transcription factor [Exilibacterium sp.]
MNKIVIIGRHELVLAGLTKCLQSISDVEVVGVESDFDTGLSLAGQYRPQVVLLDMDDAPTDINLFCAGLYRSSPATKLFLLCSGNDPALVRQAVRLDIHGFAQKCISCDELITAIRAVLRSHRYFSAEATRILAADGRCATPDFLTCRESSILSFVGSGLNNKQLANKLSISVRTVECHKRNIMKKLNISNSLGLIRYAIQRGMVA